ncbi:translation initiation factor eIF-2B [Longicatena caecimuris]|uniref:translation initiation factor eIF-2B n=1 Tax=Longicatena caecimuris TaxID=1796635 RepID=UPI0022E2B414|nr:translation initiation factor eIF-2B [Longicatena caecimuris]
MKNRVKDIAFQSADHVIEEIRNMNVKGGSPFGRAAAWAFKLALQQEDLKTFSEIKTRFTYLKKQMYELKPTMATIYNSCEAIMQELDETMKVNILKEKVIHLCDNIIEQSFVAVEKVGEIGSHLIHDHDVVLMHSYSSTLMGIFQSAANDKKRFKVICTESRPLRESRNAVNVLTRLGIETMFISDASVYEFMNEADMIIMGADTLCTNGDVANKMGSAQIARLAQSCKIPVYFASELYKLDIRTLNGEKVILERRDKCELVDEDDFKDFDQVEVINQFFDLTPASDITGIVTEFGVLHPSQMLQYWSKLWDNIKEGE